MIFHAPFTTMETSGDFISTVTEIWKAIRQSMTFSLLLGFLAVYSLVLFLDIVLLFFLRPFRADMKKGRFGTKERPFASERVLLRRWQEIESRLLSRSKSEFSIDRPEAVRVLSLYRGFLEELEVLPESSRKSSS
ncbi:MAG: hypothetical protein IPL87_04305 [Candidatus Moraniibacteriota bacterium]|nr:MAG: hypothetical protein IPL87_04305 [Candidatus Moranbacteria bacterium]